MVSHANLVAEIELVNSMSTEDRLTHARQRREEQVQRWEEREKEDESKQQNGDVPDGKRLVKFGDSVTLLEAAARDDVEEVQYLLEAKTDPNEANDDGLTALHQACIDNFEDMVQVLIDFGANVNAVDSEQWTPLHAACTCGHTNIASILVKNGADLMALNADHNMPYDICEDDETLDFIEKAMASRGITQEQINTTRSAQERQIIKDMQTVIEEGKSIDFKDEGGATVLHIASANGYVELTRFLLLHHCKVNVQDDDGWTPLHAAACWSQLEIVEMLGAENADPTVKNALGETPTDVTDDEEIKALLAKIKSAMKDKRHRKFLSGFRGFSTRNNSRRASGLRGQSFKGRSKRDKKSGISTIEAKSEAQFWTGHQEANDINPTALPPDNNNHIQTKTTQAINDTRESGKPLNATGKPDVNGRENNSMHEIDEKPGNSSALGQTDANNGDLPPNSLKELGKDEKSSKSGTKTGKKEKKRDKKSKKSSSSTADDSQNLDSASVVNETNGKIGGSLRNVIATKKRYSLVDALDENDISAVYRKENGTGKTLSQLKQQRAQENEDRSSFSSPDGRQSTTSSNYSHGAEMSDNIKQFRGQTSMDLIDGGKSKRRFCVIL